MGACLAVAAAAPSRRRRAASGARDLAQAAAGAFVAVGPALAGSVSLTRFDLWPVALVALRAVGPRRAARRHGRRAARPRDRRQAVAGARAAGGARGRGTPRLAGARDASARLLGAGRAVRVRARTLAVGPVARPVAAGGPAAADREPRRVGARLARSARRRRPVLRGHVVGIAEPDRGLGRGRRSALDARAGRRSRRGADPRRRAPCCAPATIARRSPSSRADAVRRRGRHRARPRALAAVRAVAAAVPRCSSPDGAARCWRRSPRSPSCSRSRSSRAATGQYATGFDGGATALVLVRDLVLVAIAVAAAVPSPSVRAVAGRSRSPSHVPS